MVCQQSGNYFRKAALPQDYFGLPMILPKFSEHGIFAVCAVVCITDPRYPERFPHGGGIVKIA